MDEERCTNERFFGFVRRILTALSHRVGDGDCEHLREMVAIRDEFDMRIAEAVWELHDSGYSWAQIGRALGMTSQGAQYAYKQRWAA